MKVTKSVILLCLFSLFSSKLVSVVEINRHGARTAENFPEKPLQQFFGLSEKLTHNGYRQHQILGKYMRERYIKTGFIDEEYSPKDFEIISTPSQRTIFSADGFISGLYPGSVVKVTHHEKEMNVINNDTVPICDLPFTFKEVPITVISNIENSLFNTWNCKLDGKKVKKPSKDKELYPNVLEITSKELKYSAKYLANYFDCEEMLKDKDYELFMKEMYRYIKSYFYHYNLKIEDEFPEVVAQTIKKTLLNKWYNARLSDSKMLKLGISEFLDKLLNIFNDAIEYGDNRQHAKYTVFSSHDTALVNTITNLYSGEYLKTLVDQALNDENIYNSLVLPFASNIIFELHYDNGKYYVMINFNGKILNYPLRGIDKSYSEGKIDFDDFKELLLSRIDSDYKKVDCTEAESKEIGKFNIFPIAKEDSNKAKKKHLKDLKKTSLKGLTDKLSFLYYSLFGQNL